MINNQYIKTGKHIKQQIIDARYVISKLANKELLLLYYNIDNVICEKVNKEKWGSKTIDRLSADLQQELKGLRGFSATNLKRMKLFDEQWQVYFNTISKQIEISPSITDKLKNTKKTGKFKPEYLGKMNFYLTVLDETVKQWELQHMLQVKSYPMNIKIFYPMLKH